MANLTKLRRKKRKRVSARKRQYRKYKRTGKQGHLKAFRRHKRAVKKLRRLIDRALRRRDVFASKHFRYSEFNCHSGGPVPEYMYPHLRDLCDRVLEPMRKKFGPAHITSGHRWDWYNASIGGASASYHVYEDRKSQPAADVVFAKGTPAEWAAYARQLGVGGVGEYSSFVHCDSGPRRDWWG